MSGNAIPNGHSVSAGGWSPGRLSGGSGVAAELRPCEGSGQDDGHPAILAAHPCGMTVPERLGLHLPPHRVAAPRGCRKVAVAGSSLLLSGWSVGGDSPEGARPGAREMILFFDGPADAAQMPPEGV